MCIRVHHIFIILRKKYFVAMGQALVGLQGQAQQNFTNRYSKSRQMKIGSPLLNKSNAPYNHRQSLKTPSFKPPNRARFINDINNIQPQILSQTKTQSSQIHQKQEEKLPINQPSSEKKEIEKQLSANDSSTPAIQQSKESAPKSQTSIQSSKKIEEVNDKSFKEPSQTTIQDHSEEVEVIKEKIPKTQESIQSLQQSEKVENKSLSIDNSKSIIQNESTEVQANKPAIVNNQMQNLANALSSLEQLQLLLIEHLSNRLIQTVTQIQKKQFEKGSEMPVSNIAIKRIQNQLRDIRKDPPINWRVIPDPEKWNQWIIEANADDDTPFHSIPIYLVVKFPNNYPHSKPYIKLQSPHLFYHPNIWTSGTICQDKMKEEKPMTTVRERINGFLFVLSHPNPKDPANNKAAAQYEKDYRQYRKKAFKIFRQIKDK